MMSVVFAQTSKVNLRVLFPWISQMTFGTVGVRWFGVCLRQVYLKRGKVRKAHKLRKAY